MRHPLREGQDSWPALSGSVKDATLTYVCATSGVVRASRLGDVASVAHLLRPFLRRALASGSRFILPVPDGGWSVEPVSRSGVLTFHVVAPDSQPVAACAVAADADSAARDAWREIATMPSRTGFPKPPKEPNRPGPPWLASAVLPNIRLCDEALLWLPDLEHSLAWAWLADAAPWWLTVRVEC